MANEGAHKNFNLVVAVDYAFIALVLLWDPIQRSLLKFDSAGRIVLVTMAVVLVLNLVADRFFIKRQLFSQPILFWAVWVVYSACNAAFVGYVGDLSFLLFVAHILVKPLLVMIVVAKETHRDHIRMVKFLLFVFVCYALLTLTVSSDGQVVRTDERELGGLGNLGPLNAIYLVFFASILYVERRLSIASVAIITALALSIIIPSGTRKAFVACALLLAFLTLARSKLSPGRMLASAGVLVLAAKGLDYLLDSTVLGERFQQGVETGVRMNNTGVAALDFLGDRAVFYVNGWSIFMDNFVNGIGLKNYYYKGFGGLVIHSEYMVQLVEGGVIGSALFLLFNGGLGKQLAAITFNQRSREIGLVLSGAFISILFINLTAWTYQFPFYFAVFGVIIGYLRCIRSRQWRPASSSANGGSEHGETSEFA